MIAKPWRHSPTKEIGIPISLTRPVGLGFNSNIQMKLLLFELNSN